MVAPTKPGRKKCGPRPASTQLIRDGFVAAADAPMAYPDLRMTRERVVRAIQSGKLRGKRDRERGWLVERASIAEYLKSVAA